MDSIQVSGSVIVVALLVVIAVLLIGYMWNIYVHTCQMRAMQSQHMHAMRVFNLFLMSKNSSEYSAAAQRIIEMESRNIQPKQSSFAEAFAALRRRFQGVPED